MDMFTEGSARFSAQKQESVSRTAEVFYNPVMKLNRDVSILLLSALDREGLRGCDLMAGSGVRSLRFLSELPPPLFSELVVNDLKKDFPTLFSQNAESSGIVLPASVRVSCMDANQLLLTSKAFDYLDLDPFGSPNPFLDLAVRKVRKDGILAVTATDTAPLCGTYPDACKRKYWAVPRRDYLMHEWSLRILIRKVQLVGAQHDIALTPVFSYALDHYVRVFFRVREGKRLVDDLLSKHLMIDGTGPLWTGSLWDESLARRMHEISLLKDAGFARAQRVLEVIASEASLGATVGFVDLHEESSALHLAEPPRMERVLTVLEERGVRASRTHLVGTGIRAVCDPAVVREAISSAAEKSRS